MQIPGNDIAVQYLADEMSNQLYLYKHYTSLLGMPENSLNICDDDETVARVRSLENAWNLVEESRIADEPRPRSVSEFLDWYRQICRDIDDIGEPFYRFLAEQSPIEGVAYYILLEEMIDGSFDDTIAMAQLGVKGPGKMSLAKNYWDEMGRGDPNMVHGYLFQKTAQHMREVLNQRGIEFNANLTVSGLKNGNMFLMWALRRKYFLRLLGSLGVLEDTASKRFSFVVKACERFNVPVEAMIYVKEHVHVDAIHGQEWLEHLIIPMIHSNPETLDELVTGILIRKNVTRDYLTGADQQIRNFLKILS